jgi:hypothetical protein
MRFGRRRVLVLAGVLLALVLGMVAFGPLVRSRIVAEAARRHLSVSVGSVRPGWFAVRLDDVTVRPEGVEGVSGHLEKVRVSLSAGLRPRGVDVHGGEITLAGEAAELRQRLRDWRGSDAGGGDGGTGARSHLPITADSLAVRWNDASEPTRRRAELLGVGLSRDDAGTRVSVGTASVHGEHESVDAADVSIELDATGSLVRAHAGSVAVELAPPSRPDESSAAVTTPPPAIPQPPAPVLVARATHRTKSTPGQPPAGAAADDPSAPFLRIPDLHDVRHRAAALANVLAERLPVGAEAGVDAMTWKIARPEDAARVALTIGPGPLSLTRTPSALELRFSSDRRASGPSLSTRILLPTDGSDVTAMLEGGPVALSILGVHEGAAGLADVSRATITGTAHVSLAGDGSAVTFDAELGTRGLSLDAPRLATEIVRGIDLDLRARGALTDAGEIRVDDFAATMGTLHLDGSGVLDQKPDHVAARFRFDLPSASCQSLLDSVPTALLPALQGTRMAGSFGARGRFAFDTRSLDDLELEYDVQDQCRITEVPANLARDRFKQPFMHRIYLPDGSTTQQATGPGSPNWTSLDRISPYMQVAVMTTEDGGFRNHRGFNRSAIRSSIVANLKARRFVRGASTVTMQLAKNLFLSRDKTLARKLEEVVLTDYLEQTFSKDEIIELYLNVIEFGPAVYGVTNAAEYYFGRTPAELTLSESLFLSSLLPAPLRYGTMRDLPQLPESWQRLLRGLMTAANKRGLVTDAELAEGLGETITFWHGGERPPPRPPVVQRSRLEGNPEDADAGGTGGAAGTAVIVPDPQ